MTERRLLELANNALRHHPGEFDHIVSQLGLMQEHYVDRRKPKAAPRSMAKPCPRLGIERKRVWVLTISWEGVVRSETGDSIASPKEDPPKDRITITMRIPTSQSFLKKK